jgi:hypothetical protein
LTYGFATFNQLSEQALKLCPKLLELLWRRANLESVFRVSAGQRQPALARTYYVNWNPQAFRVYLDLAFSAHGAILSPLPALAQATIFRCIMPIKRRKA